MVRLLWYAQMKGACSGMEVMLIITQSLCWWFASIPNPYVVAWKSSSRKASKLLGENSSRGPKLARPLSLTRGPLERDTTSLGKGDAQLLKHNKCIHHDFLGDPNGWFLFKTEHTRGTLKNRRTHTKGYHVWGPRQSRHLVHSC